MNMYCFNRSRFQKDFCGASCPNSPHTYLECFCSIQPNPGTTALGSVPCALQPQTSPNPSRR